MKQYRFGFRNIKIVVMVILLSTGPVLFMACSGGSGDGGTAFFDDTDTFSSVAVRMMGSMPEELADEIDQEFINVGEDSGAPLLIGSVDLDALPEMERSAIQKTLDDDIPVVLVMPTLERRQALRRLIGIEMQDILNEIPDFWGVQTSRKYEIWEYTFAAPSPLQITDTDTTDYHNYPDVNYQNGPEVTDDLEDASNYQLSRVEELGKWLEQSYTRDTSETFDIGEAPDDQNKVADSSTLPEIKSVISADYAVAQFNFMSNNYAITLSARSVYQKGNSFFIISAVGALSGEKEWLASTNDDERTKYGMRNRGRVAYKYDIRFRVPNTVFGEVTEPVVTIPKTVEGETEYSDKMGWQLGGTVTGSGECEISSESSCTGKVGVELSGGISAEMTTTFKVKDVKVENKLESGHPGWLYTIIPPEVDKHYLFWWLWPFWTFPKELSTSTFQPEMAWIWRVTDSVRAKFPEGLPIIIEFQPELVHCYCRQGPTEGAGSDFNSDANSDVRVVKLKPEKPFSVQVSIPWPPKSVTK